MHKFHIDTLLYNCMSHAELYIKNSWKD